MKTLKKITFALFFVALGTTAFSQNSIPTLLPNGKVVMIEEDRDQYQGEINDDEDDEELRINSSNYIKENCKNCYVGLRSGDGQSATDVKRVDLYDPRQR